MINNKYVIVLDTCYISNNYEDNNNLLTIINAISKEIPDLKSNYIVKILPLAIFEFIGFGNIIKKLSEEDKVLISQCFPKASDLLMKYIDESDLIDNKEMYGEKRVEIIDNTIAKAFKLLQKIYRRNLSVKNIIQKINDKLISIPDNGIMNIKDEMQRIKNDLIDYKEYSNFYNDIIEYLVFNSITKHAKWILTEDDADFKEKRLSRELYFCNSELEINKRLAMFSMSNKNFVNGVIFGRYNKIDNSGKENEKSLNVFSQTNEILDPYLIQIACSGLNNAKVIVITCEKELHKKVKNYKQGKEKINSDLDKLGLMLHPVNHGYIVTVDENNMPVVTNIENI